MDHFDEISTDQALRLADVEAYLEDQRGEELLGGRYWVAATSGSSGRCSIIPTDAHEWAMVIAGYARANEWAGVRAGPRHRTRDGRGQLDHRVASVLACGGQRPQSVRRQRATGRRCPSRRHRRAAQRHRTGGAHRLRVDDPGAGRGAAGRPAADLPAGGELLVRGAHRRQSGAGHAGVGNAAVRRVRRHRDRRRRRRVRPSRRPPPDGGSGRSRGRRRGALAGARRAARRSAAGHRAVQPHAPVDPLRAHRPGSAVHPTLRVRAPLPVGRRDRGPHRRRAHLPAADGATVRVHPVVFHQVLDLVDAAGWQVRQDADGLQVLLASPGRGVDPVACSTT